MEIKARAIGLTDVQQLIGAEKFGSDAICDLLEINAKSEDIKTVLTSYLKVTHDLREILEELSNTLTQELSNTHAQKENDKKTRSGTEISSEFVQEGADVKEDADDEPQGRWSVLVKVKGYKTVYSDADTQEEARDDVEERLGKFADTRELLDNLKPGDTDWKVVAVDKAISRTNS